MQPHAIIFDMGNTLLSYAPLGTSWRASEEPGIEGLYWELVGLGHCQKIERDRFVERLFRRLENGWREAVAGRANLRAADWIAAGLAELQVPANVAPLDELVALYIAPRRAHLAARPGAATILATLHSAGYRLGLISNTIWPGHFHTADLASLELLPYLEQLTFSGDVGIWKPSAEIFLRTVTALGITPDETILVGDNPNEDIAGAQAAGLRAVWVETPEFPLGEIRPDGQIANLEELPALLEAWQ